MISKYKVAIIFAFLCLLLWIASFIIVLTRLFGNSLQDYGVFGDSFGCVNSLFSGLALIGVVFALIMQQKRQEGEETEHKELMALQREMIEAQKQAANALTESAQYHKASSLAQMALADAQNKANINMNNRAAVQASIDARRTTRQRLQNRLDELKLPKAFGQTKKFEVFGKSMLFGDAISYLNNEIAKLDKDIEDLQAQLKSPG